MRRAYLFQSGNPEPTKVKEIPNNPGPRCWTSLGQWICENTQNDPEGTEVLITVHVPIGPVKSIPVDLSDADETPDGF